MDPALLQGLLAGAGSTGRVVGGLVIALLYATIGLLGAIGSITIFRRAFRGRWEQIVWASFLIMIACFYLGFAAYFAAPADAWRTELIAVAVFLALGLVGLFLRPAIAAGYVMHGIWDASHSLSGSSLAGLSITEIPLGYGVFCLAFDLTVACYLAMSDTAWHEAGRFDPDFWRPRP
ncbi:MAG TPA: DUF6010 family protein [Geminicoccaceae bacterium]